MSAAGPRRPRLPNHPCHSRYQAPAHDTGVAIARSASVSGSLHPELKIFSADTPAYRVIAAACLARTGRPTRATKPVLPRRASASRTIVQLHRAAGAPLHLPLVVA